MFAMDGWRIECSPYAICHVRECINFGVPHRTIIVGMIPSITAEAEASSCFPLSHARCSWQPENTYILLSWVPFFRSTFRCWLEATECIMNRRITRAHLPCSSNRLSHLHFAHDARLVRISWRCGLREYKLCFDVTSYSAHRVPSVSILYLAKCETAETPLLPTFLPPAKKAQERSTEFMFRYGVRSLGA